MGFRFRKSIKIAPGLKVNLGLKGVSLSIGGKGTTVNVGKNGVRGTLGIPGTGISYSENIIKRSSLRPTTTNDDNFVTKITFYFIVFMVIAGIVSSITTPSLKEYEKKSAVPPDSLVQQVDVKNIQAVSIEKQNSIETPVELPKISEEKRNALQNCLTLQNGEAIAKCLNKK